MKAPRIPDQRSATKRAPLHEKAEKTSRILARILKENDTNTQEGRELVISKVIYRLDEAGIFDGTTVKRSDVAYILFEKRRQQR